MRVSALLWLVLVSVHGAGGPVFGAWPEVRVWVDDIGRKYRSDAGDGTSGASSLNISCARNEFESFQILIYNGSQRAETIKDVTVTQTAGPGAIDNIYLYRMHYINVTTTSRQEYGTGYWPDPLVPKVDRYFGETRGGPGGWPPNGISVGAGKVQGFWVDIGTKPDTPAGTYAFRVSVKQDGQADKTATVTLTVWDFVLPSTPTLRSFFTIEGSYLDDGHGLHLNDAQTAALEAVYVKAMMYHRIAPSTADGGVFYTTVSSTGAVNNWTNWETAYRAALDGTAITEGTYAGARLPNIDIELGMTRSGTRGQDREHWIAYLQSWWDKFNANGWDPMNRLYAWALDEPAGNNVLFRGGTYTDYQVALLKASDMNAVNTSGAGVWRNTFVTESRSAALSTPGAGYTSFDSTGIYVPPLYTYTYRSPWQTPNRMKARNTYPYIGTDVGNWLHRNHFSYIACDMTHGCGISGEAAYNNAPDLMVETPPVLTRGIGWLLWHYRSHGLLYYSVNLVYGAHGADPYYRVYNQGGNGEGILFYPGVPTSSGRTLAVHTPPIGGTHDIPVESIRLKLLREAMEDREYMEMLRKLGAMEYADQQVNSIFTSTVTPPGAYYSLRTGMSALSAARERMAEKIVTLQGRLPR